MTIEMTTTVQAYGLPQGANLLPRQAGADITMDAILEGRLLSSLFQPIISFREEKVPGYEAPVTRP